MLIKALFEKHENIERDAEINRLSTKINQTAHEMRIGFIQKRENISSNQIFVNFGLSEAPSESKFSLMNIATPLFVTLILAKCKNKLYCKFLLER